jgi:hypothetical protein
LADDAIDCLVAEEEAVRRLHPDLLLQRLAVELLERRIVIHRVRVADAEAVEESRFGETLRAGLRRLLRLVDLRVGSRLLRCGLRSGGARGELRMPTTFDFDLGMSGRCGIAWHPPRIARLVALLRRGAAFGRLGEGDDGRRCRQHDDGGDDRELHGSSVSLTADPCAGLVPGVTRRTLTIPRPTIIVTADESSSRGQN